MLLALLAAVDARMARAGAWLALLVFLHPTNADWVGWLYLIFQSAVSPKEPRFLLPVLPLLAVLAAAKMVALVGLQIRRRPTASGMSVASMIGVAAVFLFGL